MVEGVCKLCLTPKLLRRSHFLPAALYPKNRKLNLSTYQTICRLDSKEKEIRDHLLCFDCEQAFDRNGESEVLQWVSPKGPFRLAQRLEVATPRETIDHSLSRFSGEDIGVDMEKFAYFAISVVWRGAVHDWKLPDGAVRPHDELGGFVEPMRLYLSGDSGLPPHTSVIVIAGSDDDSRRIWNMPQAHVEANCLNFRFLTFGIAFRVMIGRHQPEFFRVHSCTSPRKCLFYGNMSHRMPEIINFSPAH